MSKEKNRMSKEKIDIIFFWFFHFNFTLSIWFIFLCIREVLFNFIFLHNTYTHIQKIEIEKEFHGDIRK